MRAEFAGNSPAVVALKRRSRQFPEKDMTENTGTNAALAFLLGVALAAITGIATYVYKDWHPASIPQAEIGAVLADQAG